VIRLLFPGARRRNFELTKRAIGNVETNGKVKEQTNRAPVERIVGPHTAVLPD
jgi:hypothetical protein